MPEIIKPLYVQYTGLSSVVTGNPIDELTKRMVYEDYIRKTKIKYRLAN